MLTNDGLRAVSASASGSWQRSGRARDAICASRRREPERHDILCWPRANRAMVYASGRGRGRERERVGEREGERACRASLVSCAGPILVEAAASRDMLSTTTRRRFSPPTGKQSARPGSSLMLVVVSPSPQATFLLFFSVLATRSPPMHVVALGHLVCRQGGVDNIPLSTAPQMLCNKPVAFSVPALPAWTAEPPGPPLSKRFVPLDTRLSNGPISLRPVAGRQSKCR